MAQFAETEGFTHVHFHIVPRPAGLAGELRGPRIFGMLGMLGVASADQLSDQRMDDIALALTRQLAGGGG